MALVGYFLEALPLFECDCGKEVGVGAYDIKTFSSLVR
jgi:hypothetical protein